MAAYADKVKDKIEKKPDGELAKWMETYMEQVEVLLRIIKGCREGIHEEYLMAVFISAAKALGLETLRQRLAQLIDYVIAS